MTGVFLGSTIVENIQIPCLLMLFRLKQRLEMCAG